MALSSPPAMDMCAPRGICYPARTHHRPREMQKYRRRLPTCQTLRPSSTRGGSSVHPQFTLSRADLPRRLRLPGPKRFGYNASGVQDVYGFDFHAPRTWQEAFSLLDTPRAQVIAGGTDLIPLLRSQEAQPP